MGVRERAFFTFCSKQDLFYFCILHRWWSSRSVGNTVQYRCGDDVARWYYCLLLDGIINTVPAVHNGTGGT